MAQEEEEKKEEKFEFDAAGEALGYISLDQARVQAMQAARETPGDYGRRFSGVPMAFDIVEAEETEDYYVVTLSVRPQGEFSGVTGREQFFIEKEGAVAVRQVLSLPRSGRRTLPLALGAGGVVAAVVAAAVGVLFVSGVVGGGSGPSDPVARVSVTPGAPAQLVSLQGDVIVDMALGSVSTPAQLVYQPVAADAVPQLPVGYIHSQKVFDLSLVPEAGSSATSVSIVNPITITVRLTTGDLSLAGGEESNVVIQHYVDGDNEWLALPTTVDFTASTAQAQVDSLSIFALTIKQPGSVAKFVLGTTVDPLGVGVVTGAGTYSDGSQVNLQATPNAGWNFTGWSGACSGTGSCAVTLDANKSVTASFTRQRFTLTANADPSAGGTVGGAGTYDSGDSATLQATPSTGWSFTGWAGACSGTGSCVVTVDASKSVTASFTRQRFTLTANADPSAGGTVGGAGTYDSGDSATLLATPSTGWELTGWAGACSGTGSCGVTMDSNKSVTAIFARQRFTVTANADPSAGGTVSGAGTYDSGDSATLQATPSSGWDFTGWSGACGGTGSCAVTLDSNKSVTASFTRQRFTLTANADPTIGGTVGGSGTYDSGDGATLQATPSSGWAFAGWSGACSGTGSCVVSMDSDQAVTARFTQEQHTLTATASPSNGGTIAGPGTYAAGIQVTVEATPNLGWAFVGWAGACSGTGSCVVSMDSDQAVTASFTEQQYTLTATGSPSDGGTVGGAGTYAAGIQVIVEATPNSGWIFSGWSGACAGTGACVVTMDAGKIVTATFTQAQYTLTVTPSPSNGGTVAGAGTYAAGTQVTMGATANSGWNFTGWSGACSGTSACVVTMDSSKSVTAGFTQAATDFDSYVSPDGKWSISYPKGFRVNLTSGFGYTVFGSYPSVQVIHTPGAGSQYTLDAWTSSSLDFRRSNRLSFQILSFERVIVGGILADEVVFFSVDPQFADHDDLDSGGTLDADIVLYLLVGGDGYAIDALSPQETWSIMEPILKESIYTFRSPPSSGASSGTEVGTAGSGPDHVD